MRGVLLDLAKILGTLPGLGPRSARRIAITLALQKDEITPLLVMLLERLKNVKKCRVCNNLSEETTCYICSDSSRDHNQICIVSEIMDLWAIERIGQFNGVYHVLGGTISVTNVEIEKIDFEKLEERINCTAEHMECIIAMNPTISGQATVHYIQSFLKHYEHVSISTLALGIPMGAELDYLDNGTIAMALNSRKEL